jgi:hypothetical protein
MSNPPPKPPLPTPTPKEHAEFNWPPTDEELAQCFNIGGPDEKVAEGAVEREHATVAAQVFEPQPTMAGASELMVAETKPALDGTRRGDWTAQIAQLQTLIEALTEEVEWGIPNASRR